MSVARVVNRAIREIKHRKINRLFLTMDINSLPDLDLDRLLAAPDFDFAHDIIGILRHMDRSAYPGKLTGCFEPRCGRISKP
jgi:hypothetical protein